MRIAIAALLLLGCVPVWAHKPSDSYLTLAVHENVIDGRWDVALRDLDHALGLDADQDGAITWGELRRRHDEVAAYVLARLELAADGSGCPARVQAHEVDDHSDGAYAVLSFRATCPAPPADLRIRYSLFFDLDPQHKGLARLAGDAPARSLIFSATAPAHRVAVRAPDGWQQFRDYVREGVWHIWIGFDHILFLLSLLLPAVFRREGGSWRAAERFAGAAWDTAKVVTAFTAAHSITLSLAALGMVSPPTRWVESAIAASVVLAALNNVWPVFGARRWTMAFAFGLIHGFGFAAVLADLGLPQGALVSALVAFNAGVELGQLAIVMAFLPIAWWLREHWVYRRVVFVAGSLAVAAVAAGWLLERALDWRLFA